MLGESLGKLHMGFASLMRNLSSFLLFGIEKGTTKTNDYVNGVLS